MFKLEFGIVHEGCAVNELSRALPDVRVISGGGFIISPHEADEVLIVDSADDGEVSAVIANLENSPSIDQVELLERTASKAFVRIHAIAGPPQGYCSQVVERNRGFNLGLEVQHGGVEHWKVGCHQHGQAEQLIDDLKQLGELRYARISEASWEALLDRRPG